MTRALVLHFLVREFSSYLTCSLGRKFRALRGFLAGLLCFQDVCIAIYSGFLDSVSFLIFLKMGVWVSIYLIQARRIAVLGFIGELFTLGM